MSDTPSALRCVVCGGTELLLASTGRACWNCVPIAGVVNARVLAAVLRCPDVTEPAELLARARDLAAEAAARRAGHGARIAEARATARAVTRLRTERDAARARVAELERALRAATGRPERPMTGAEFIAALAPHAAAFSAALEARETDATEDAATAPQHGSE